MKIFQLVKSIPLVVILLFGATAFAAEWQPFDQASFQQAQAQGKTVVLDFHADWCPTCQKQKSILQEVFNEKEFESVVGFTVNFDAATELKQSHNVIKQSTLIVFKGKDEIARNMGVTDKTEIKALILKGL